MSTALLDRPSVAPQRSSPFTGTLGLLRLYLRRDRVALPLWVLLLSVPLASVYIGSIERSMPPTPSGPDSRPPSWPVRRSGRSTARSTTAASAPSASGKPECSTC